MAVKVGVLYKGLNGLTGNVHKGYKMNTKTYIFIKLLSGRSCDR